MENFVIKNGLDAKYYGGKAVTDTIYDRDDIVGATARLVFHYRMVASNFTSDLQLDYIRLGTNTYSFETDADGFETTTTSTLIEDYNTATFVDVETGTTTGRVNRDAGGTPSTGTGLTTAQDGSYYLYFETSTPANVIGYSFILRSPAVTLTNNTVGYFEARSGTNMGDLGVYLDVTDVGTSSTQLGLSPKLTETRGGFGAWASWLLGDQTAVIDLSKGNYFKVPKSQSTLNVIFVNPTEKNEPISFIIEMDVTSAGGTISWWSDIAWAGGSTPASPTPQGTHKYLFYTSNNGIYGSKTYIGKQITRP